MVVMMLQTSYVSGELHGDKEEVPTTSMKKKKCRTFKKPQNDFTINNMSNKNFSDQSKRRIKWAVNMHCEWRVDGVVMVMFQNKFKSLI